MNVAVRVPAMSREEFLDWVQRQEGRFEFDGARPVAMTGGTLGHGRVTRNILLGLLTRLAGSAFEVLGSDCGVATAGGAVRYPDALVTSSGGPDADLLVPGVFVVFEVLSPSSGRTDRIVKVREYRDVPSIRRYVIVEFTSMALTVFARVEGGADWTATTLTADDVLAMPEIGVEFSVRELYAGTDTPETEPDGGR